MKQRALKIFALTLVFALGRQCVYANFRPAETFAPGTVPSGINFQGRLVNDDQPVTGQRNLRFRLYDALTGGTLLWQSASIPTQFEEGIFGAVLDIPTNALIAPGIKYLEFEVENIILEPRERLRPVPYARIAEVIEGAVEITNANFNISTSAIQGEAMFVSSETGNVGFGAMSPPTGQRVLVDRGDFRVGAAGMAEDSVNEDVFIAGNLIVSGSIVGGAGLVSRVELLMISTTSTSSELMKAGEGVLSVLESGRLGINTIAPQASLDIEAGTIPGVNLDHATQSVFRLTRAGTPRLNLLGDAAAATIQEAGGGDLILEASGQEVMRIAGGGNVGISTGLPSATLDVNGDMNVSMVLTLGTELSVSSGGTGGVSTFTAQTALDMPGRDGTGATGTWGINTSGNAGTFSAFASAPAVCSTAGQFMKGVLSDGDASSCVDASASVDQSEGVNEPLIYDDDNDLGASRPWSVTATGTSDIKFDKADDTFYIDVSANRVGVGTPNPSVSFDVQGGSINVSGKMKEAGSDLIPAGAITFSTRPAGCPTGWSEFTAAQGYMIVGLPSGGVVGATVGSALTDQALLAGHAHTLSGHTHTINVPSHDHAPGSHVHAISDPGTHGHSFSGHTHDNFDPDGGVPHSHTGTHQHPTSDITSSLQAGDNTTRQGSVISPGNVAEKDHTHSVTMSVPDSTGGTLANTNTKNLNLINTDAGSASPSAAADAAYATSANSGAPTSQTDRTGGSTMSGTSGAPSTDTTDTLGGLTQPYLQLWVCQKD